MKKEFGLFILLAVFGFALISCGGEKKTDTAAEETQTESAAVEVAEVTADLVAGEEVYNKYCFACHKEGIAGSPKLGDATLWGPRAEKGMATLIQHVTTGFTGDAGVMPPMGTCMDCKEQDFRNAISFMLSKADLVAK